MSEEPKQIRLGDLLTEAQANECVRILNESQQVHKDLRDHLASCGTEAEGVLPDYLAYYLEYLRNEGHI
jgi:hypothetical protein